VKLLFPGVNRGIQLRVIVPSLARMEPDAVVKQIDPRPVVRSYAPRDARVDLIEEG
jgi:hypothetical protein